jgi:hypothetical protein
MTGCFGKFYEPSISAEIMFERALDAERDEGGWAFDQET